MLAILPAAFGRLCVETLVSYEGLSFAVEPAAFGRLCVETTDSGGVFLTEIPAAFGRLCVETSIKTLNGLTV